MREVRLTCFFFAVPTHSASLASKHSPWSRIYEKSHAFCELKLVSADLLHIPPLLLFEFQSMDSRATSVLSILNICNFHTC